MVKYLAGSALKQTGIREELSNWVDNLASQLISETKADQPERMSILHDVEALFSESVINPESSVGLDIRQTIRQCYRQDTSAELRREAGRIMGRSPTQIWVHEHPILAIAMTVAAVIALGIVYIVVV